MPADERLRFGYITNGMVQHRLDDALAMLADVGYDGVGLTLDPHHLDPLAPGLAGRVAALARRLGELGLAVVIETGASYLLDPRRKHEPTLVSRDGSDRRVELLDLAVAIAADLGAEAVSFWAGVVAPDVPRAEAWDRLVRGCEGVVASADRRGVTLGFEPEPGMLVDRLDGYEDLLAALGHPPGLGLTLDIGHCVCVEPEPVPACVARAAPRLVNVHIEDMRRGVHEHLDFGDGEVEFPPALAALQAAGYRGLVSVELSRHSHAAHVAVPRALRFLRSAEAARPAGTTGTGAAGAAEVARPAGTTGTGAAGAAEVARPAGTTGATDTADGTVESTENAETTGAAENAGPAETTGAAENAGPAETTGAADDTVDSTENAGFAEAGGAAGFADAAGAAGCAEAGGAGGGLSAASAGRGVG